MASLLLSYLSQILENMPSSWRGTTFDNSNLLGREGFAVRVAQLLQRKGGQPLTQEDLKGLGEAEDYLRVASNVSTLLEMVLAEKQALPLNQVFTFSSRHMPILSVCFATGLHVRLYLGTETQDPPFAHDQLEILKKVGVTLTLHPGSPQAGARHPGEVIVVLRSVAVGEVELIDAIVSENVLYIKNVDRISPSQILIRRKRMSTPITTPAAEAMLRDLAGLPVEPCPPVEGTEEMLAHLQTMSGAEVDIERSPLCFSAGLPAVASLWAALCIGGGADVLMASTAYGGSSQLTDLMEAQTGVLRKHTFDLQGLRGMEAGIEDCLNARAEKLSDLLPTTVLFVETPTNPDMKVPSFSDLTRLLKNYGNKTGRNVLLLVDTTFAPASRVLEKIRQETPELPAVVFLSMSKSVSRGMTVAGALVFNETEASKTLHRHVKEAADLFDAWARPDQMQVLNVNHKGVEERCEKAYRNAVCAGESLVAAVKSRTGREMRLAFVSQETAAAGFTTSTFSFNLPPLAGASDAVNEALAQRFVDLIAARRDLFKPCVSFGQDNGVVYATVPATSTQGAIRAEDKAKQAEGGVQLTRLSFPPTIDMEAVNKVISEAVNTLYV